jgi:iron complex outermembrane recepter protein
MRFDERFQNFGQLDPSTGLYNDIILNGIPISNEFTHDRHIHGGYLSFTDNRGRLTYQLGLRGEYTTMESWQGYGLRSGFLDDDNFQPAMDTITSDSYFRMFPSVFMNYKISENQDVQASYSRRIRRPWVGSMMPFLNAQDFFNLRLGNPYLEPAHTDNFEINYIRAWQNYMVTGGVFHRYTTNGLSRLFVLFDQGTMVTWTNANTQNSTGVELINYFTWNDNTDITLTGNFFHSEVSSQVEGQSFSNQSYSWTLSLMGNKSIPNWFSTQVSANYWGPRVIPQGQIKPVFSMNLGLRRNVMNNQGTISLNISDVFNTRRFALETNGTQFTQQREFFRESRVLTLAFTWRFRDFRERNGGASQDSFEGDMDGLF